jgi:mannose-6-phosphate isomerase-like protein (cupin superfamily)
MQLQSHPRAAIDLTTTPLHLGLGSRALAIDGFAWDPAVLGAYGDAVADDGPEGRRVMVFDGDEPWTSWERHPAGDEVVVCLQGRITIIRELDGAPDPVALRPGEAMVNPAGVWHTADLDGPTRILAITPGLGTEHRPR